MSREVFPKEELLRFVLSPEEKMILDLENRLPGRGCWVRPDLLQQAVRKKAFKKPNGKPVTLDDDFIDVVTERLKKRIQNFIGLAKKAGVLIVGTEKVKASLIKEESILLLEASDAGRDSADKMAEIVGKMMVTPFVFRDLTASEMGYPLDREVSVYLAVKVSDFAQAFQSELERYHAFLTSEPIRKES